MKLLKSIRRAVSIRRYKGGMKLSPLIVETAASIFTGLFLFLWGVIFFSNPLYQQSLFMKIRNAFILEEKIEEHLSSIYCIGLDPESRLSFIDKDESYTDFDLIALALEEVRKHAVNHPEIKIVAGLDYAFASTMRKKPFSRCIEVLSQMPPNMFVVIGSVIIKRPDTMTTLRISLLENDLLEPLLEVDPSLEDRLFLGNIHVALGNIRSGFEEEDDKRAAIGYTPVLVSGASIPKYFTSLALTMFIVGEVMDRTDDGRYNFYTDFGEGFSVFDTRGPLITALEKKSGRSFESLMGRVYLNYFTGNDIADSPAHFIWLSNLSPVFENALGSLDMYFSQPFFKARNKNKSLEYFFIAPSQTPKFILQEGEENDIIFIPTSDKDPFTHEERGVHGVMSHVTALSNLRNCYYITEAPPLLNIGLLIILAGCVFIFNYRKSLGQSIRFTLIIILSFMLLAYILFMFGILLPVTVPIGFAIIVFGFVVTTRFIFTSRKDEIYETVALRVFSPSQIAQLKEDYSWHQPAIYKNAIMMALFPRKLPPIGKTKEEAERYAGIYEYYISTIQTIMEKFGGNHMPVGSDGLLGFWNVPEEEEGTLLKALACARECLSHVTQWQEYIHNNIPGSKKEYTATFDICLNKGACYAGCIGTGNLTTYSLSGDVINFTIEAALYRTRDLATSLILTESFYSEALDKFLIQNKEFKKTQYKNHTLYSLTQS
ncbi:MAG: hypothetical protein JW969_02710 [Spirochaetales bacterium]|nr:hypothetical protein [Spirochaetales bacterium]